MSGSPSTSLLSSLDAITHIDNLITDSPTKSTKPKRKTRERKPCGVCGMEARSIGFAALVCKSCAVFYRRSYKLLSGLHCKRDGNCNLSHELRNVCRYCRLMACRRMGLRMVGKNLIAQCNGYPEDDIDEETAARMSNHEIPSVSRAPSEPLPSSHNSPLASSSVTVNNPSPDAYPELRRIIEAVIWFENSQRQYCDSRRENPVEGFSSEMMTKMDQFELENATLRLAAEMIKSLVVECDLTADQMAELLKKLPLQIATAHKAELTNRVFPDRGDSRVAFYIGHHLDLKHLEAFLNSREDFERMKHVAWPLFKKRWEAAERCRQIRPDLAEWSAFMGVLLFEELSRIGARSPTVSRRRDQLYAEFFRYLTAVHRDQAWVSARIVRIVSFTHEVKEVNIAIEDMYQVADIFVPEYSKTAWVIKPDAKLAESVKQEPSTSTTTDTGISRPIPQRIALNPEDLISK